MLLHPVLHDIAAGLGVLVATLPRLAAMLEAATITGFTVLVWVPALFTAPTGVNPSKWTGEGGRIDL